MARVPRIRASVPVEPTIYAYSTPEIARHDGWVKIGYTETQTADARVKQQVHTVDVIAQEEWRGPAVFDDGSHDVFTDREFHRYLQKLGIERTQGTEWFHVTGPVSEGHFRDFRSNRGLVEREDVAEYSLRSEQEQAVQQTAAYAASHPNGEFLWNAKPRFGKTLAAYALAQSLGAEKVLIVTNRPTIASSWYSDYETFLGSQSGYVFISDVDLLKNEPMVLTHAQYDDLPTDRRSSFKGRIEFVSLQDLKGAKLFGGSYDKLEHVADIAWDLLVIDEAHEGVDTYRADVAFEHVKRDFTLHLSGTPFRALADDKFESDAIFNWTYADEQRAKRDAQTSPENPYATLPQLNLFTYRMSDIVEGHVTQGMEIDGTSVDYAFDLNEFFRVKGGRFVHDESVDRFLDALTTQEKFPFSTEELRNELKHTFWLLPPHVESAKALARKLRKHPVFGQYEIVLVAGDGRLDDADETTEALVKVRKAINEHERTITVSVGRLTTGVTVSEWTGVLMLSGVKSPALYMQAAFRAQNPNLSYEQRTTDGQPAYLRKENAYVFDFDPARTLAIFEQFACDLASGQSSNRATNVRELLNFFPVIGEDENGQMIELNADEVLSIPRAIRSREVVRRGFMSGFLFQNISSVFRAPADVLSVLRKFEPEKEGKVPLDTGSNARNDLHLDANGKVRASEEEVSSTAEEVFGGKRYGAKMSDLRKSVKMTTSGVEQTAGSSVDPRVAKVRNLLRNALNEVEAAAREQFADQLTKREWQRWRKRNTRAADLQVDKAFADHDSERATIESELAKRLQNAQSTDARRDASSEAARKLKALERHLVENLSALQADLLQNAQTDLVRTAIEGREQAALDRFQVSVRDCLRGFARTIPSFLMAYGNEDLTLANYDQYVEPDVFREVTGITLDEFHLLRDGRTEEQARSEGKEPFGGHLFDEVVFDDSVRRFLQKKEQLKNYFESDQHEDIFSYIPPQRTDQIFTPRHVVQQMLANLEEANPGCFDDPNTTFADLFMKSGLYIAEIVKRLYHSEKMRELFPNDRERIQHIMRHQVYGMAPTRILYLITTSFILGFDEELMRESTHFVQADAAEAAKHGQLQELVDKHFGQ